MACVICPWALCWRPLARCISAKAASLACGLWITAADGRATLLCVFLCVCMCVRACTSGGFQEEVRGGGCQCSGSGAPHQLLSTTPSAQEHKRPGKWGDEYPWLVACQGTSNRHCHQSNSQFSLDAAHVKDWTDQVPCRLTDWVEYQSSKIHYTSAWTRHRNTLIILLIHWNC